MLWANAASRVEFESLGLAAGALPPLDSSADAVTSICHPGELAGGSRPCGVLGPLRAVWQGKKARVRVERA